MHQVDDLSQTEFRLRVQAAWEGVRNPSPQATRVRTRVCWRIWRNEPYHGVRQDTKEWVRVIAPHPSQGHFFAADCAQCASVVRNGFAPAGASTFPVRDVLNGTMRP